MAIRICVITPPEQDRKGVYIIYILRDEFCKILARIYFNVFAIELLFFKLPFKGFSIPPCNVWTVTILPSLAIDKKYDSKYLRRILVGIFQNRLHRTPNASNVMNLGERHLYLPS